MSMTYNLAFQWNSSLLDPDSLVFLIVKNQGGDKHDFLLNCVCLIFSRYSM